MSSDRWLWLGVCVALVAVAYGTQMALNDAQHFVRPTHRIEDVEVYEEGKEKSVYSLLRSSGVDNHQHSLWES